MKRDFTEALLALALSLLVIGVLVVLAKTLSFDDFLLLIIGGVVAIGILLLIIGTITPNRNRKGNFCLFLALLLCGPVFGQEPTYNYITEPGGCLRFCGPGAIGFAIDGIGGIDQIRVSKVMDWQHYHGAINNYRENLQDSPAAHKLAILKLGFRYKVITCQQILRSQATPNKTVILVHPSARQLFARQHWCVLAPPKTAETVRLHWGNGTIREVLTSEFEDWYSRGLPACAYEIISAPKFGRASWLNWLYDWFFRKIT